MSFVGNNGEVYQQSGGDGNYLYTWQNPTSGITVIDNHVDGIPFEPVAVVVPDVLAPPPVVMPPPAVTTPHYDPPPIITAPPPNTITEIHMDDHGGHVNPVPEPSTASLLMVACVIAALWFQFRRKVAIEPSGGCKCAEDYTDGTGICWHCRKTRVV